MSQLGHSNDHQEPVIEPSNGGVATVDITTRALHLRIRQQEILAELGLLALQGKVFPDLLDQTARLTAAGMERSSARCWSTSLLKIDFWSALAWVGMKVSLEWLAYDADFENIDLGAYLEAVCADAASASSNSKLHFEGIPGIRLSADRAISLALIVNELVTNAVKYAFSNRDDGRIHVRLTRQDAGTALVSVRDDGIGLAADFDLTKSKGLGMQIVTGLAKQLGANITRTIQGEGNEFVVSVPSEQISET